MVENEGVDPEIAGGRVGDLVVKGVLFLGLVGAAIYGAILLTYDLLPHDPAAHVFTGQNLGNPDDRQLRSWGTDLPALASSSSQEASLALPKTATTPVSPSPLAASTNYPMQPARRRSMRCFASFTASSFCGATVCKVDRDSIGRSGYKG
jgi:hypothetical protein